MNLEKRLESVPLQRSNYSQGYDTHLAFFPLLRTFGSSDAQLLGHVSRKNVALLQGKPRLLLPAKVALKLLVLGQDVREERFVGKIRALDAVRHTLVLSVHGKAQDHGITGCVLKQADRFHCSISRGALGILKIKRIQNNKSRL